MPKKWLLTGLGAAVVIGVVVFFRVLLWDLIQIAWDSSFAIVVQRIRIPLGVLLSAVAILCLVVIVAAIWLIIKQQLYLNEISRKMDQDIFQHKQ